MMKQLTNIIIVVLLAVIILMQVKNGCRGVGSPGRVDTVKTVDTLWERHDTTIYKKMQVIKTIHDSVPPKYLPNPMYDSLLVQYNEMVEEFLAKNIYLDSLTIPGYKGNILIKDTVQYNKLGGRSYISSISIPKVTETITIIKTTPPKSSLFIGGGISANKTAFQLLDAGLLLKTKKDKIYGVSVGIGQNLKPIYGIKMYWKLF